MSALTDDSALPYLRQPSVYPPQQIRNSPWLNPSSDLYYSSPVPSDRLNSKISSLTQSSSGLGSPQYRYQQQFAQIVSSDRDFPSVHLNDSFEDNENGSISSTISTLNYTSTISVGNKEDKEDKAQAQDQVSSTALRTISEIIKSDLSDMLMSQS